jgi:phosphoenolpyruvate carboxykinase (ATP)
MTTEYQHIANAGIRPSRHGLEEQGFRNLNVAYWNLGTAQLLEHAIQRREGNLASGGSFVVHTGQFTGRSPKDKFVVRDETTDAHVQWGDVNQPLSEAHFDRLYSKMMAFWQGHDVYVQDCFVGADAAYGMPIRVVSQLADTRPRWRVPSGDSAARRRRPSARVLAGRFCRVPQAPTRRCWGRGCDAPARSAGW